MSENQKLLLLNLVMQRLADPAETEEVILAVVENKKFWEGAKAVVEDAKRRERLFLPVLSGVLARCCAGVDGAVTEGDSEDVRKALGKHKLKIA